MNKSAGIIMFDYATLAVGERFMDELIKKANLVSSALQAAGIPHAVVGGLAMRAHVAQVDRSALMTTRDMDILMRREDLEKAAAVLAPLGFEYRVVMGTPAFIPAGGQFRDAVHVLVSGEKPKKSSLHVAPELRNDAVMQSVEGFPVIDLGSLLYMKLSSLRPKDIGHVEELLELNLITDEIVESLPADLRQRLIEIRREKDLRDQ